MDNKEKKIATIEGLKKSNTFSKNDLTFQILHYLVEEEAKGREAKSSTIALDVLGPQDGFNGTNQDAYIRNKLFNIRKELKLYYLTEGINDPIKLSIPKGAYKIELTDRSKLENIPSKKVDNSKRKFLPLLTFFIGLLVACSFFLFKESKEASKVKRSLVSLLLDNNEPLDIIVGSRAFYYEYDPQLKRRRYIFDTDVELPTSSRKMNAMMFGYPERRIRIDVPFYHTDIENMYLAAEFKKEWALSGTEATIEAANEMGKLEHNLVFISKMESSEMYDLSAYFYDSKLKHKSLDLSLGRHTGSIKQLILDDSVSYTLMRHERKDGEVVGFISHYLIKKVTTNKRKSLVFLLAGSNGDRKYINQKLFEKDFQEEVMASFEGNSLPDEFELLIESYGSGRSINNYKIVYNSSWSLEKQHKVLKKYKK